MGDRESGMDPESAGQFEADSYRVYQMFNDKWTNKLRGQFLRVRLKWQILGGKPYLIPHGVCGCGDASAVGVKLVPLRGFKQGCAGSVPSAMTPPDVGLD